MGTIRSLMLAAGGHCPFQLINFSIEKFYTERTSD